MCSPFIKKIFLLTIQIILLLSLTLAVKLRTPCDLSLATPGDPNEDLLYHDNPGLNYYYIWNKTTTSAIDYNRQVCADRCDNGVKVFRSQNNLNIKCLECECKRPACEIYGICCEDISDSPTSSLAHSSPALYCDDVSMFSYFSFLCIRSCPKEYRNIEVKKLCEEDVSIAETTTDTFMRAVDNGTEVIYYNIYCAMCNNVSKVRISVSF
ncbi:hypothetical protein Bpfe_001828 [Biomphalaria pfeifferi]|uniref:SMB domain-containing protein n=1 Tax=Biomphalaria pfeifferi TaxID=112525 RepID=A0AAD8CB85_BIOPF|nr:hypothetical protein Bpfe_001828 [Biomphalaria pfeifferi]